MVKGEGMEQEAVAVEVVAAKGGAGNDISLISYVNKLNSYDFCPFTLEEGLDIFQGDHIGKDWFEAGLFDRFAIGGLFVFVHDRPHDLTHLQVRTGRIEVLDQFLDFVDDCLPGQLTVLLRLSMGKSSHHAACK